MTIVFDGRGFAAEEVAKLDKEVAKLKNKGIHPRLASILVGQDSASLLYVSLKKKATEKIGVEMDIYRLGENETCENIITLINSLNKDPLVQGIMVQLPLPLAIRHQTLTIIDSINFKKDVDGLRKNSRYLHPTAMAILQIIKVARLRLASARQAKTICVIGKGGMVGSALLREIKNTNYKLIEDSKDADILVSATGSPNIIKADMVKKGAVIIDVGSPKGDIDPSCYKVAGFITPVPGGIGPVTIACLLENLIVSAGKVC